MNDRTKGFIMIGISYTVAFSVGSILYFCLERNGAGDYLALFTLDCASTIIVWIFGLIYRNSSFYDPYWSVAPHVMLLLLMIHKGLWSVNSILFFVVFSVWSVRLSVNWAQTFRSIKTEDWRYQMYREKNPTFIWHIINFFGINFMPTVIVFAAFIPAISTVKANADFKPLSLIGAAVILCGATLELFADIAIHRHQSGKDKNCVCRSGLWKYSRHPNYLGEITVWYGVWFMSLAVCSNAWKLCGGSIAINLLFLVISIPMMEKRQLSRRPEYEEYRKQTSKLLLRVKAR